jgi:hypothetical protein
MEITLTGSVGLDGVNHPSDIRAVKQRLVDLGFCIIYALRA